MFEKIKNMKNLISMNTYNICSTTFYKYVKYVRTVWLDNGKTSCQNIAFNMLQCSSPIRVCKMLKAKSVINIVVVIFRCKLCPISVTDPLKIYHPVN